VKSFSRRETLLALGAAAGLAACGSGSSGSGPGGKSYRKLGVAIAGVGGVVTRDVIPAVRRSKNCRLAGFVSSGTEKLRSLGKQFDVPESGQYTYEQFDRIADNPDIDIVYIALPNALHAEYTVRAAQAGKHVLCEKPMAVTVEQCEQMIEACGRARRALAVAYRLHYSPHHQQLIRSVRENELGNLQIMRADIGYPMRGDGGWRLKRDLAGGGVLLEQGVYPVYSARTLMGAEPVEVLGYESRSDQKRFSEVEETVSWSMRFANGAVAHCAASYTVPANRVWAGGSAGWFALDDAYSLDDIAASTQKGGVRIGQVDQFVLQLDNLSRLIQDGAAPGAGISGMDGLRDVRIISAIYESIRTAKVVQLNT
jgi:predicted dehydrogenase